MDLDFDLTNVEVTEFCIGYEGDEDQEFHFVPVDTSVQQALVEIAEETWTQLNAHEDTAAPYDPSEKHASKEYVYVNLDDPMATRMRDIHTMENVPVAPDMLKNTDGIFCYLTRLTDGDGRRLTGIRRATQFKGVLKSRLITLGGDALKMVEDEVFKLDREFDALIDAEKVHILRPSGFEFIGGLEDAILDAVPANVTSIQQDLPFVDFSGIESYAKTRPRAARYLASIRSLQQTENIDRERLLNLCKNTDVEVEEHDGTLVIPNGSIMGFLQVLDRRRYELELVKDEPERFTATSRKKIG